MTSKHTLVSKATIPQHEFINSAAQFPALVAGYGAGKTEAAIKRALKLKWDTPEFDHAYYLPTYGLVRDIGYPRFEATLDAAKVKYKLNKSDHVIKIAGKGNILFRTMEDPERIVGYEVADSTIDELDTLTRDHAKAVWERIIARNRKRKPNGKKNTVGVATTPEGFRFVYDRWERDKVEGHVIIRASTYSNLRNLPPDYIDTLRKSYPAQLIDAYIEGKFVNLTSGSVYPDFLRILNGTTVGLQDGEELHIGLDFNVYNCTAIICVIRDDQPVAVGELTGMRDTPHVIQSIKEKYPSRKIYVYPDASGQSNKTVNATESDITLLRAAGFSVMVKPANPLIKERVMAVNGLICNSFGKRTLKVNIFSCPKLVECLEQQIYDKNGMPDKTDGKDHAPDAIGYFIYYRWPIQKPNIRVSNLKV